MSDQVLWLRHHVAAIGFEGRRRSRDGSRIPSPMPTLSALEMPPKVKQHLGLDDARSWIVLDEVNQFDWPGFDLHPVPGRGDKYVYGFILSKLYEAAKQKLLDATSEQAVKFI